jgi:hypothetical protein
MGAAGGGDASKEVQRRYDIAYQQCMYSKVIRFQVINSKP